MNINRQWLDAQSDLECAKSMFNNSVSPFHTDIAIKAISIAEQKLELYRELTALESVRHKAITPAAKTKWETIMEKLKKIGEGES